MFYACGGSKTLVKHTFFIMILTWDKQKHWQAPKKQKKQQTTRCTKHRQAPNKKQKFQQLIRSGPIVPGNFSFCFFLVPVQVWWLWLHKTLTGTKKKQTTRCTKHRQAPKKTKKQKNPATTQKWTHSSWKFLFFVFFGACAGLVHLVVCFFCLFWCLCRFGASIGLFVFFMPVQVLVILDCVCFGSWPYFKLMFQRSKHTVIFE